MQVNDKQTRKEALLRSIIKELLTKKNHNEEAKSVEPTTCNS